MYPFGNYCGPYWSAGEIQASVVSDVEATDALDDLCKRHDHAYATNADLDTADQEFTRETKKLGLAGWAFGSLVEIARLSRPTDSTKQSNMSTINKNNQKKKVSLRGAQTTAKRPRNGEVGAQMTRSLAPVAVGTTIRAVPPRIRRTQDMSTISGRDFIAPVEGNGVAAFGIGKSALLSPAYFNTTVLGNMCRSFEKYRWNRLRIHYVPKVATTLAGQVILCSSKSVFEPCLQPEAGTFLQRAMSQGNAAFSPLWQQSYIDIDCSVQEWHLVDVAAHSDTDDNVHEELQVYTQTAVSGQVGYLFAEYDVSFKEPIYAVHSTLLPYSTGPGLRTTLIDFSAINAIGDDFVLTNATLTAFNDGSIFRCVLDIQGSTPPTGTTFANALNGGIAIRTTAAAGSAISTFSKPVFGGWTFYVVVVGTVLYVYTSMEGATAGGSTGSMYFRTVTSAVGAWVVDTALVRYGENVLGAIQ